jgi:Family of unknown function (DUF5755)
MAKRRGGVKCPPGTLCISGGLGTTLVIILSVALLFLIYAVFFVKPQAPTIIMPRQPPPQTTVIPIKGGDSRYDMAPQPLRDWMAPPEYPPRGGIASIPINIPTQGLPESFQSVGVVRVDDKILPLYGRRTAGGGGDRWNYYTRTDTYNPVPIPVRFQKRDCMDDVGCQEILSGDTVKVEVMGKDGHTSMYKYDGPKYIPGLI